MKYCFKQLAFPVKRQWMKEAVYYVVSYSIFGLCLEARMTGSRVKACRFPLFKFSKTQHFPSLLILSRVDEKRKKPPPLETVSPQRALSPGFQLLRLQTF